MEGEIIPITIWPSITFYFDDFQSRTTDVFLMTLPVSAKLFNMNGMESALRFKTTYLHVGSTL